MPENTDVPQNPVPESASGNVAVLEGTSAQKPPEQRRPSKEEKAAADAPYSSGVPTVSLEDFKNPEAIRLAQEVQSKSDFFTENDRVEIYGRLRRLSERGKLTQAEGDTIRGLINIAASYEITAREAIDMRLDEENFRPDPEAASQIIKILGADAFEVVRSSAAKSSAESNVRAERRKKRKNKDDEVRESNISSRSLIPLYLDAMRAVNGDVDAKGTLLNEGFATIEDLKKRIELPLEQGGDIGYYLSTVGRLKEKDWSEDLQKLSQETTEQGYRKRLTRILNDAENLLAVRTMNERGYAAPDNIQGIAWDIAATDKDDFRIGGKYAVFKRVREGEGESARDVLKFQPDNFIEWGRSKMVAWDDDNPDDPQDMTKIISVFGAMRGVGLGEMMLTAGFFRDEDTGKTLDDLKIKLIYEAWPFGTFRNDDILYKSVSGSDDDISPKALIPILDKNTITKPNVLNNLFTLTDVGEGFDPKAPNTKTGRAARRALLAYYYLADEIMLNKILKTEGSGKLALFDNDAFFKQYIKAQMYKNNVEFDWGNEDRSLSPDDAEKAEKQLSPEARELRGFVLKYSDILFRKRSGDILTKEDADFLAEVSKEAEKKEKGKYDDETPLGKAKIYVDAFISLSNSTSSFFDSKGALKKDNGKALLKQLNFFDNAMPSTEIINETRERIRMSIMQSEGVNADTAEYVERFVYRMTRWSGIAARNDLGSVGHDAWSKVMNTSSYLQHQSLARRVGASGNRFAMGQFKRIGVDLFTGISDSSKKSILEFIQGGQGEIVDLSQDANTMSFAENTAKHFGSDHVHRVFQVFHRHAESKALKLNEIIKIDHKGRAHVSDEKLSEVFRDSFLKEMRYPYATWTGIDFTEEVRIWEDVYDDEKKEFVSKFTTKPLARHMFGKEMFKNNGEFDYSIMLKYEALYSDNPDKRAKAKKYYQLEQKLNALNRNKDVVEANIAAAKAAIPGFDKLKKADQEDQLAKKLEEMRLKGNVRQMSLADRLRNDTESALTFNDKKFMIDNEKWYTEVLPEAERAIIEKTVDTFTGQGRGFFWKEAAKVMIASEIKEARQWRGGTNELYMTAEACDKLYKVLAQMGANNIWSEDDIGSARYAGKAWSKKDIREIQKMSGTRPWWTTTMEFVEYYGSGLEGIWKALMHLLGAISK